MTLFFQEPLLHKVSLSHKEKRVYQRNIEYGNTETPLILYLVYQSHFSVEQTECFLWQGFPDCFFVRIICDSCKRWLFDRLSAWYISAVKDVGRHYKRVFSCPKCISWVAAKHAPATWRDPLRLNLADDSMLIKTLNLRDSQSTHYVHLDVFKPNYRL